MIDIGKKKITSREAVAEGKIILKTDVLTAIKKERIPKGNVLEAARLAGILAAKKTPDIIPLCHPLPIEYVGIDFSIERNSITIITTVRGMAKTGFEMESLTATAIAALTIYDMCKPLDKAIIISSIRLLKKMGGKSGAYIRKQGVGF